MKPHSEMQMHDLCNCEKLLSSLIDLTLLIFTSIREAHSC
jgi:hypothetical protein